MNNLFKSLVILTTVVLACYANITPAVPFEPSDDADALYKALKAKENTPITDILTRRTDKQRQKIAEVYKIIYEKSLADELANNLTGDYKDLMVALATPLSEFYVKEMIKDTHFFARKSNAVVDTLLASPNKQIFQMSQAYRTLNVHNHLRLRNIFRIGFQGLTTRSINSLIRGERHEAEKVDDRIARNEAIYIHKIAEVKPFASRTKNDDSYLEKVFIRHSPQQSRKIFEVYQSLYEHPIEQPFMNENNFENSLRQSILNTIAVVRSPVDYFASRLYDSMYGSGTNDRVLIRTIVGRSEIDLDKIRDKFPELYKTKLTDMIEDDTSGEYQRALVNIVNS